MNRGNSFKQVRCDSFQEKLRLRTKSLIFHLKSPKQNSYYMRIAKKIAIVGTTGSGKTTLARRLSELLNYPHIELDDINWLPDWEIRDREEFVVLVLEKLKENPTWIIDGNYSVVRSQIWQEVEMVIWLDYSYFTNFRQLFLRTIERTITQKGMWSAQNKESFGRAFFTKDSILYWFYKSYDKRKITYSKLMNDPQYQHISFVHIQSHGHLERWISCLSKYA